MHDSAEEEEEEDTDDLLDFGYSESAHKFVGQGAQYACVYISCIKYNKFTYIYIYIHTKTYTDMHIYTYTHIYIYTHIHIYTHTYVYVCVFVCLCMFRPCCKGVEGPFVRMATMFCCFVLARWAR